MVGFNELKSIAGVLQEAGKIPQYQQILEVQEKLLEMQKRIFDLEIENKELKEKLETNRSLIFENNAYWTEQDGIKAGPFCSCCWDDNKKTIRMQPCGNPAYFDCPKCKNKGVQVFHDKNEDYLNNTNNKDFDPYSPFGE